MARSPAAGAPWQEQVLARLDAPATAVSIDALTWWADSEGVPSSWHNWLATTMPGYGGRTVNSAGVQAYPSVDEGAAATAATLENSAYRAVVAALRSGTSLSAIFHAVNASPWCRGCQGGRYPVVLWDHLGQAAPKPAAATGSSAPGTSRTHIPAGTQAQWGHLNYLVGHGGRQQYNQIAGEAGRFRKARS